MLIVIIVIAILALIVTTTYNGVSQKAANSKTIAVVSDWAKAIGLYYADQGSYPPITLNTGACLGEGYPYGQQGVSPTNQCRSGGTSAFVERASFVTALRPYIGAGPLPTPDFYTVAPTGSWARGAIYTNDIYGGGLYIGYALQGVVSCPSIGGTTKYNQTTTSEGNTWCRASLAPSS